MLNALVSLEVFEKAGSSFRLRTEIQELFNEHPGLIRDLIHHDHLYNVWGRFEKGIKMGKSVPPPEEETRRYPESLEVFLHAMRAHAGYLASELISRIPWQGVKHMLDIGGGGGGYALALTREFTDLAVTIADLPDAAKLTEEMISRENGSRQIEIVPCNAYSGELPAGPFDRIFISHMIHIYPAEENRRLVQKAASLLKRGGDLLLLDFFLDDSESAPREAAIFRILMMIGTPEGDCYLLSKAKAWITDVGLKPCQVELLPRGQTLLRAENP